MIAVAERASSVEMLQIEECEAWGEYLEATRREGLRYEEVEPWAWSRLAARLGAVTARRRHLVPEDSTRRTDADEGSSPAGASEVSS